MKISRLEPLYIELQLKHLVWFKKIIFIQFLLIFLLLFFFSKEFIDKIKKSKNNLSKVPT